MEDFFKFVAFLEYPNFKNFFHYGLKGFVSFTHLKKSNKQKIFEKTVKTTFVPKIRLYHLKQLACKTIFMTRFPSFVDKKKLSPL